MDRITIVCVCVCVCVCARVCVCVLGQKLLHGNVCMYICMYTMHDKTEFDFTEGYVQSLSFHYRQYHLKTVIKVNYFSLGYCTETYVRTYTRGETFSYFICMQILSFDTCVHTYIQYTHNKTHSQEHGYAMRNLAGQRCPGNPSHCHLFQ